MSSAGNPQGMYEVGGASSDGRNSSKTLQRVSSPVTQRFSVGSPLEATSKENEIEAGLHNEENLSQSDRYESVNTSAASIEEQKRRDREVLDLAGKITHNKSRSMFNSSETFGLSGFQSLTKLVQSQLFSQSPSQPSTARKRSQSTEVKDFEEYLDAVFYEKEYDDREIVQYKNAQSNTSKLSITALPSASFPPLMLEEEPDGRMTKAKWLAAIGLALAYTTAFQQGLVTGIILKSIDEKLGPTNYYEWLYEAGTITNSLALPLAGGLSDIFGRRWFFIIGALFSLLGSVIAVSSQNEPMFIAGMIVAGFGGGSQQLATAAIAEIVPNKHRGIVQGGLALSIAPWSLFGPLIGGAIVTYQKDGLNFRINFIVSSILNGTSLLMAYFWYFPPSSGMKLGGRSKRAALAELDWIGILFLGLTIILILVPVSLGGAQLAWHSAGIIALFSTGGAMLLALLVWEAKFAKNPFLAPELFAGKTRTFTTVLFIDFVAGMGLYASMIFWAYSIQFVWGATPIEVGMYSIPGGFGLAIGGGIAGFVIGKHPLFRTNLCLLYGCLCKAAGDSIVTQLNPTSFSLCLGGSFLSMFGTGWTTVVVVVCTQLACRDVDIGLASLLVGSVRAIGGSAAIALFSTLLENYLEAHAGIDVAKVVLPLGLPFASLKPMILALINQDDPDTVVASAPGITPEILEAAQNVLQGTTYTKAFRNIYLASASFGVASVIAALITKDVSHNMTNNVAVKLENERRRVDAS